MEPSDERIRQGTGIVERHLAADGEIPFSFTLRAAQAALDVADQDPAGLDLIIVATVGPTTSSQKPLACCRLPCIVGNRATRRWNVHQFQESHSNR